MGIYLDGQLVIADDLLITGDFKLLGGGNIETVANNDLTLLPNGTGITIVGDAGSTSHGLNSNDDTFHSGKVEIDGILYQDGNTIFGSQARFNDAVPLYFGGSDDARLLYSTSQTPDTLVLGVGVESRSFLIVEKGDQSTDFAHALQVNPTLFIQSADATTIAQWVSLCHDQTDAVLGSGAGDIKISTVANQTLVLVQSVYEDMRVPLVRGLTGAANPPAFAQFKDDGAGSVGVYAYSFADEAVAGNEEQMWFDVELPHAYKEGTDLGAHVHWTPVVGGGVDEYVKWGLEYTWVNIDGTFGNTTIITSNAATGATATTSGDTTMLADKHYVTAIGTIDGTGKEISGVLVCRLFRNSSDATDDLAQAAFGLEMAFHFEIDTLGSRQEFIK